MKMTSQICTSSSGESKYITFENVVKESLSGLEVSYVVLQFLFRQLFKHLLLLYVCMVIWGVCGCLFMCVYGSDVLDREILGFGKEVNQNYTNV